MTTAAVKLVLVVVVSFAVTLATQPSTRAQTPEISVSRNEAMLEFPDGFRLLLDAEATETIVRAELHYVVPPNKTINISVADVEPGSSVSIEHSLDLVVNYIPPGIEMVANWVITTEAGHSISTEPQTLFWHDDRFDWELYESADVRIYTYSDDVEFVEHALDVAQTSVDELELRFDVSTTYPVNFWLYESGSDLESALAPNSRDWIGGITLPEFPTISAVLAPGDEYGLGRLIPHELCHQVLYQATKNPFAYLSNWLDEGLASSVQLTGTDGFDNQVELAYQNGTLPSLQSLIAEWPADREQAAISYASAYSVVQYLIATYGEDALSALLDGYTAGLSHDEALIAAIGLSTVELDQEWRDSLA